MATKKTGKILMAALKMGQSKGGKKWRKDKAASKAAVACKGKGKFACGVVYKRGKKSVVVKTSKDLLWRMPGALARLSHLAGSPDIKVPREYSKGEKLKAPKKRKGGQKGKGSQRVKGGATVCQLAYRKLVELERKHGESIKGLLTRVKKMTPKGKPRVGRTRYADWETSGGTPMERSMSEEL